MAHFLLKKTLNWVYEIIQKALIVSGYAGFEPQPQKSVFCQHIKRDQTEFVSVSVFRAYAPK